MAAPRSWTPGLSVFYLWHFINGLIHICLESTCIYGCFAHHVPVSAPPRHPTTSPKYRCNDRPFLGYADRSYGNVYGSSSSAKIWQEVARADARYAGVDLTTLSLEIITVVLAGPIALYVAERVRRDVQRAERKGSGTEVLAAGTCFWAAVLATGELYGG
ncbi:MAG: hypothetical protein Q9173_000058 [Seirophora scorigena]